jgi:5-(aminomethyl)-3-furanmethanol phosphate kinase
MASDERPIVVKVGGSLFDLPHLGKRLHVLFKQFDVERLLLVPGGGAAADAVRLFDRVQQIGEERAHWCALQAMELSGYLLGAILGQYQIVSDLFEFVPSIVAGSGFCILNASAFMSAADYLPDPFPHRWDVSSDSVAARAAIFLEAQKLILLKSVTIPPRMSWTEASQRGYVDKYFPTALAKAGDLDVEAVNFRQWQPPGDLT